MWRRWSLRAKIMTVAMGVVLPVMAATTALTVRMSRQALEDDIRTSGLTLARELATSVAASRGPAGGSVLQHEIESLLGRGGVVRDVAMYSLEAHGLVLQAAGGTPHRVRPEDEIAARERQEVGLLETEGGTGLGLAIWRRITRDHGGSIRLESAAGRGTRAVLEFPVPVD